MEPFHETPSEMAVSERVRSGVKHSELLTSQRQRGQTKGCQKQKVASAAALTLLVGTRDIIRRSHSKKRQREKMVKMSILGLKLQHL